MTKRLGATLVALTVAGTAWAGPQATGQPAAKPATTAASKAAAQQADDDRLVDLLRKDVRAGKADVIAKTMNFDSAQAAAFWPVYKQYEAERQALGDERLGIIQDFAEHYDTLNDVNAKGLVTRFQALEEKHLALQKKYVDQFMKVLPPKTAARFLQVDRRLNMLIDLELSSAIPLVN
jgi:pyruvate/2-oxoglutarate dehydrogenase complex dihydrolipoamide acyltransferase (E2) component